MKIQACVSQAYQNAVNKGFYERATKATERFQLMLSEVSEATEEFRSAKDDFYMVGEKPEGQSIELIDVLIRIFDYSGSCDIDLASLINQRFFVEYNKIETLQDLMQAVSDLNNIKCYQELENVHDDLEYQLSVSISIAQAGKSYLDGKDEGTIFLHLSDTIVKIARIFYLKQWDIEKLLSIKHAYNVNRPHKHGGKVC